MDTGLEYKEFLDVPFAIFHPTWIWCLFIPVTALLQTIKAKAKTQHILCLGMRFEWVVTFFLWFITSTEILSWCLGSIMDVLWGWESSTKSTNHNPSACCQENHSVALLLCSCCSWSMAKILHRNIILYKSLTPNLFH